MTVVEYDENNFVLYVLIAEAILFIIGGFVVGLWPEIWIAVANRLRRGRTTTPRRGE